jgi:riboflavin kinase/FMN adenylyltransferase
MKLIGDVTHTTETFPHVVLTVGSFDGVHRGHQRILEELVRTARRANGTAAVMTMQPHPRECFAPEHAPNLLTTDRKKLDLLRQAGVDVVFVLPFTPKVALLDRREFVERILVQRCRVEELIVGHDFRFGREAAGDYHFLLEMGAVFGFKVSQVPPLIMAGERVSSTAIRERLLDGDLEEAESFLGRKYAIVGEVVRGRGIGAELGFPTANIRPHHTAVPAQGVYAAEVLLGDRRYPAAVNIGIAPTIRHDDTVVEAHLLDFNQDIRGREIEVVFHKRLRTEKRFASHADLAAAIRSDVETVRQYFHTGASSQ